MTTRQASRSLPPLLRVPLDRWQDRDGLPGDALLKDGLLAVALALAAFLPPLAGLGAQIGDLPERPAGALGFGLVLAQTLPLAARRRWPAACATASRQSSSPTGPDWPPARREPHPDPASNG